MPDTHLPEGARDARPVDAPDRLPSAAELDRVLVLAEARDLFTAVVEQPDRPFGPWQLTITDSVRGPAAHAERFQAVSFSTGGFETSQTLTVETVGGFVVVAVTDERPHQDGVEVRSLVSVLGPKDEHHMAQVELVERSRLHSPIVITQTPEDRPTALEDVRKRINAVLAQKDRPGPRRRARRLRTGRAPQADQNAVRQSRARSSAT